MSKLLKKALFASASLLMMASLGAGTNSFVNAPVHAESENTADNRLSNDLYSGWSLKQRRVRGYSIVDPAAIVRVRGHVFIYNANSHGVLVDGRKVSYKRGLTLYHHYSKVHHHYRPVRHHYVYRHHRQHIIRRHRTRKHQHHLSNYKKFYNKGFNDHSLALKYNLVGGRTSRKKELKLDSSSLHRIKAYQRGWNAWQALRDDED